MNSHPSDVGMGWDSPPKSHHHIRRSTRWDKGGIPHLPNTTSDLATCTDKDQSKTVSWNFLPDCQQPIANPSPCKLFADLLRSEASGTHNGTNRRFHQGVHIYRPIQIGSGLPFHREIPTALKPQVQLDSSTRRRLHSLHNNERESSRNDLLSAATAFENGRISMERSNETRCISLPFTSHEGTTSSEGSRKLWSYRRPSQAAGLAKCYSSRKAFENSRAGYLPLEPSAGQRDSRENV